VFEVDFFAALELTRLAIPYLKVGQRPMICNVTSVLAYRGVPLKSEYCAAKFALRGWSESLRVELMDCGINVVTVAPSTTRSEFFDALEDPTGRSSRNLKWAQSAQQVARRIVRTLKSGRREAVLSLGGKALVCFSYWLPGMCDRLLNRFAK
jgi:short-subunit dehydrogenase